MLTASKECQSILYRACIVTLLVASVFAERGECFADSLKHPVQLSYEAFKSRNYLAPLAALEKERNSYLNSVFRPLFLQEVATYQSFVGDYLSALSRFDQQATLHLEKPRPIPPKYISKNAVSEILRLSKTNQVLMINEAHHVPMHRAFTLQLLKGLYENGFRYFAAETFADTDSDLNKRGYPLIEQSGFYTSEPLFGEMVRLASQMGYQLVPYEDTSPCTGTPTECQNHREKGQALNLINRILVKDSKAKIFVHAGYGHIAKIDLGERRPMARYFAELSGINPLSIDQTSLSEHGSIQFENPYYRGVLETRSLTEPTIFISAAGEIWRESDPKQYDAQVFHPRTQIMGGRPTWLALKGRTPFDIPISICKNQFPCLIQVFPDSELEGAVPTDQVRLLNNSQAKIRVFSFKTPAQIIARDSSGAEISRMPFPKQR